MMNSKVLIDVSYSLGVEAFKSGKKCVPVWDKALTENCIKGLKVGEGSVKFLDAWLKGWHDANLDRI